MPTFAQTLINIAKPLYAAAGVWRVAFAFDPRLKPILLVAGNKSGISEKRFYRQLIEKADRRFAAHLSCIKKGRV